MVGLAIIPARGGSKGLPRKNVLTVAGKPLLAWTIEAALRSHVFGRIIVSTEDDEITRVARKWGGECPFRRPVELAQDETSLMEVVLHALRWFVEKEGFRPDYVMALQPTSPLRTAQDIQAAVDLMLKQEADAVVSVGPVKAHPYWMKKITDQGRLIDFVQLNHVPQRRQELPPVFLLNGAIYLASRDVLLLRQTFYTEKTYAYVMPPERSLDIDTNTDLQLVEAELLKGVR